MGWEEAKGDPGWECGGRCGWTEPLGGRCVHVCLCWGHRRCAELTDAHVSGDDEGLNRDSPRTQQPHGYVSSAQFLLERSPQTPTYRTCWILPDPL